MKEKLKAVILVPYVASYEDLENPSAEAEYLFNQYFKDCGFRQIIGDGFEGRMYIKDTIGLYIIGEGKTNASINCTALLNDSDFDFSQTKFILFGCCGAARDVGVVGDVYLIGELVDGDLGHHADFREFQQNSEHSWYPNESFTRFGYIDIRSDIFNKTFDLIKEEKAKTTPQAKNFMAKSFNNESWAIRSPQIMKATSVTSDIYWKGNFDHDNAKYIVDYYNCDLPFAATQMEDIAVGQVFKKFNKLEDLLILRFAVNTDVFMAGQNPEVIWGNGQGSFDSTGFDDFNDIFPVVREMATEVLWKIIDII